MERRSSAGSTAIHGTPPRESGALKRLAERGAVRNLVHPAHLPTALAQNEARGRAAGLLGQPGACCCTRRPGGCPSASRPSAGDDVLVVDNMLAAHGREPFTGPRKIAVAMAEPSRSLVSA
ncbi:hypothetical protein [Streptomyces sp. NPDC096311]|uniref:hypothetical protein n=1 Tax=Streptomyces sp. NPDC096311 TaxID=3366083 RepID=UPI00381B1E4A